MLDIKNIPDNINPIVPKKTDKGSEGKESLKNTSNKIVNFCKWVQDQTPQFDLGTLSTRNTQKL